MGLDWQKGQNHVPVFPREDVEGSTSGAIVHGLHPNALANEALQQPRRGKSDAIAAAKNNQFRVESQ
jgi:hypothetical protein